MAVAGLRKALVLDSYIGENHSPALRMCGDKERSSTQTSSIRKMWRDLESEGRVVKNGKRQMRGVLTGLESPCSSSLEGENMEREDNSRDPHEIENERPRNQNQFALQNELVNDNRLCLQRSSYFDVPEKEHVRKIFQEWGSKSSGDHTSYSSCMNNCSRAQCLEENECKRVRIVRELIKLSTQQGDTCRTVLEESAMEIGSQIERVRDGSANCDVVSRRSIRRIYGRQALLDLLAKFERERERELEGLLENRLVSNFAHRHRLQSLLKGRFLWNQRFVENAKQASVAASELGLLRQTHAVSDVRKGFLSRMNNYNQVPEGAQSDSDTSSDNEVKYDRIEQSGEIVQEIPGNMGEEYVTTNLTSNRESHNPQEFASSVGERHDKILRYEEREKPLLAVDHAQEGAHSDSDTSSNSDMMFDRIEEAEEIVQEIPDEISEELETTNLTCGWEACKPRDFASPEEMHHNILQYEERENLPLSIEFTETRSQDQDDSVEIDQNSLHVQVSQGTLVTEASVCLHPLHTGKDRFNWQEVSTQAEEWQESVTEYDDGGWHHLTRNESDEGADVNSNENEDGWYEDTVRSDLQESHEEWDGNVLEDATDGWFGANSYREAAPVGRSNALYGSDDDNGSRFELQELTSRRRVSNLLHSDFGARLDQLMQSYVDRQDQAFEMEDVWMPGREQQDQERQSLDENADGIEAVVRTEVPHPSPSVVHQTHRDDDLQGADDRQFPDIQEHHGTEWEIINGLKIDMDTLKQRMNDMQRMLEACMDMQLELQRSVQQEIYSALNRSSNSGGTCEDGIRDYDCELSRGKERVCSLCCGVGFESLPYRSAHMYICSKCAEKIDWLKLKESVRHT